MLHFFTKASSRAFGRSEHEPCGPEIGTACVFAYLTPASKTYQAYALVYGAASERAPNRKLFDGFPGVHARKIASG